MQDSKSLVLFIILSVGILIGWGMLFPPPKRVKPAVRKQVKRPQAPGQRTVAKHVAQRNVARKVAKASANPPTTRGSSSRPSSLAVKPAVRPVVARPKVVVPKVPVKKLSFKGKLYNIQISNQGGSIVSLEMNRFHANSVKRSKARLNLISRTLQTQPPLTERFLDPQLQGNKGRVTYTTIAQPKPTVIVLRGKVASSKGGYVEVEKRYIFSRQTYQFGVEYSLKNRTSHNIQGRLAISITDHEDPKKLKAGSMFSMPEQLQVLCHDPQQTTPQRFDSKELAKSSTIVKKGRLNLGQQTFQGKAKFAGVDRRYFTMAMVPEWGPSDSTARCSANGNAEGWVEVVLQNTGTTLAPNASKKVKLASYFGPKYYGNLKKVKPGSGLESSVNFGFFAFLSRPMLWLMQFFYNSFDKFGWGNWGICIILLTLLVKLLTWPLTNKSMKSMKKMQVLKPQMDRLKEKYGDDKESFQREMMNVYVKEGINPVSGCIPMLVQMPIWIALYNTLFYAVELYQAPFIPGWINDLSAKDPVYILPISLGVAMFAQQRFTPQTMDNTQAKVMLWAMPIFFTGIMLFLPAGLTLYIFVNTILGLLHHLYIHNQPDEPTNNKPNKKKKAGWMERMQAYVKEQEQRGKPS